MIRWLLLILLLSAEFGGGAASITRHRELPGPQPVRPVR